MQKFKVKSHLQAKSKRKTQLCPKAVVFTDIQKFTSDFLKNENLSHLLLALLVYLFKQKCCFYAKLQTSFSLLLSLLVNHQDQCAILHMQRKVSLYAAITNYYTLGGLLTFISHSSGSPTAFLVSLHVRALIPFMRVPPS